MRILLHRSCRAGKIITVEIYGNVFEIAAPEVVCEAHQSVKLILIELANPLSGTIKLSGATERTRGLTATLTSLLTQSTNVAASDLSRSWPSASVMGGLMLSHSESGWQA